MVDRYNLTLAFWKRKTDIIYSIGLIAIQTVLFRNILRNGFYSYWDLVVPSSWMNTSLLQPTAVMYGLSQPFSLLNSRLYLQAVLIVLFGNFGIHLFPLLVESTLAIFAYTYMRYFELSPHISFFLSLVVLFNPFVLIMNVDSLVNIYQFMFVFPFIVSYYHFRVERKIAWILPSALFMALPSIYGNDLILFFSIILFTELSIFIVDGFPTHRQVSQLLMPIALITVFVLVHLGDLLVALRTLRASGGISRTFSLPSYNLYQIITFQAVYPWENSIEVFFSPVLYHFIAFAFVAIFVVLCFLFFLNYEKLKTTGKRKHRILVSTIFPFIIFSFALASFGSDYLFVNTAIHVVFPEIYVIDPWDNGIYVLLAYIFLFQALLYMYGNTSGKEIRGRPSRVPGALRDHWKQLGSKITSMTLSVTLILALITVPLFAFVSFNLGNSITSTHIPSSDVKIYNYLESHGTGYLFPVPYTYGVTFNYSRMTLSGIGNSISRTNNMFWWTYPPMQWLPPTNLSLLLRNCLYRNTTASKIQFDSLANLLGVQYLLDFNPSYVTGIWYPTFPNLPALPTSYILNMTDFKIIYSSRDVTLFQNPSYRGIAYTVNDAILANSSQSAFQAILYETSFGASLPVVVGQDIGNASGSLYTTTSYSNLNSTFQPLPLVDGNDIQFSANTKLPYFISSLPKSGILVSSVINDYHLHVFSSPGGTFEAFNSLPNTSHSVQLKTYQGYSFNANTPFILGFNITPINKVNLTINFGTFSLEIWGIYGVAELFPNGNTSNTVHYFFPTFPKNFFDTPRHITVSLIQDTLILTANGSIQFSVNIPSSTTISVVSMSLWEHEGDRPQMLNVSTEALVETTHVGQFTKNDTSYFLAQNSTSSPIQTFISTNKSSRQIGEFQRSLLNPSYNQISTSYITNNSYRLAPFAINSSGLLIFDSAQFHSSGSGENSLSLVYSSSNFSYSVFSIHKGNFSLWFVPAPSLHFYIQLYIFSTFLLACSSLLFVLLDSRLRLMPRIRVWILRVYLAWKS